MVFLITPGDNVINQRIRTSAMPQALLYIDRSYHLPWSKAYHSCSVHCLMAIPHSTVLKQKQAETFVIALEFERSAPFHSSNAERKISAEIKDRTIHDLLLYSQKQYTLQFISNGRCYLLDMPLACIASKDNFFLWLSRKRAISYVWISAIQFIEWKME